jgi:hypothetical protein
MALSLNQRFIDRVSGRVSAQRLTMTFCHRLLILSALATSLPGCGFVGGSNDSRDAVIPDRETARRALELALSAWVESRAAPLLLERTSVQFSDHDQRVGNRLSSYEVLSMRASDRFPIFTVRLHWQDPGGSSEPDVVEYFVGGTQPIWVIRHDELQMLMHWEHPMDLRALGSAEPQSETESTTR